MVPKSHLSSLRRRQFGCHGGLCRDVNGLFHEKKTPSLHPDVASAMEMKAGEAGWKTDNSWHCQSVI